MLKLLLSRGVLKIALPILLVMSIVGYSYYKGVDNTKQAQEEKANKEFVDTTKRINNAPTSRSRDDALDLLRSMGDLR